MASTKGRDELFQRLRAGGLRKRTAKLISDATDGRRKPAKSVQKALADLGEIVNDVEDRVSGGPAKRKAAAKKAAATRKRNATRRSVAAKKAARTRSRAR